MKLSRCCARVAFAAWLAQAAASKAHSLLTETSESSSKGTSFEDGLETLETALVALEAKRGTPGVQGTVDQVTKMIVNMKNMVKTQTLQTTKMADDAWADLLTCNKLYDSTHKSSLQSVESLAAEHADCREAESNRKIESDLCKQTIASLHAKLQEDSTEFKAVNVFPQSGFCKHRPDAYEYTNAREYMLYYRNTFAALLHEFEHVLNETTIGNTQYNAATIDCYGQDRRADGQGGKEGLHRAKKSECDHVQTKLENAACLGSGHTESCQAYVDCFTPKFEAYYGQGKAKMTALAQLKQSKSEYHAIQRIGCVLASFTYQAEDTPLSDLIEGCRTNSHVDPGFLQYVPPDVGIPIEDHRDCQKIDVGDLPGSTAFTTKSYETLITQRGESVWASVKDEVLNCKGSCCQEAVVAAV
mmetsp:Transcript_84406/g.149308  ORF Transcript_84406/g.149308 Transcript_84406/m.149308 type:complete len:415 (+) Transcript_84406:82-1326(+)|eukprot:CAMPEP_0197640896 /NCGR_PEP_ID=MMETSP1338-20131121/15024_1 /TAXON_ID=43686 ORGANISM="Pelagodinium beii, Strain RCC1491" /NCGR_SAMPLE_ID=MMETSP1338 /ASSEMBLY_ACC=CAM_ASM_000754 /LENGTH=414 /DNA_ID=CAMNT_0043213781 /DNA_START=89 /DNA_END=1333 /DNA_ORIENTATION=+